MNALSDVASWVRKSIASTPPIKKNTREATMKRRPTVVWFTADQPRQPGFEFQSALNALCRATDDRVLFIALTSARRVPLQDGPHRMHASVLACPHGRYRRIQHTHRGRHPVHRQSDVSYSPVPELHRFSYPNVVSRNHGSRLVC